MSVDAKESRLVDDEMLLRRRRHRKIDGGIEGLNLTAMMDIMTIILVFLIKQYESAPDNITLTDDLMPPKSSTPDELEPAVTLTLSQGAVLLDGIKVFGLVNHQPETADGWGALGKALSVRRDQLKMIEKASGKPFDGALRVIADENTPYDTVSQVLLQAGREQFTKFKLILQAGGSK